MRIFRTFTASVGTQAGSGFCWRLSCILAAVSIQNASAVTPEEAEANWAKAQNLLVTKIAALKSPAPDQIISLKAQILAPEKAALKEAYAEADRNAAPPPPKEEKRTVPVPGQREDRTPAAAVEKKPEIILDGSHVKDEIIVGKGAGLSTEPTSAKGGGEASEISFGGK